MVASILQVSISQNTKHDNLVDCLKSGLPNVYIDNISAVDHMTGYQILTSYITPCIMQYS